MSTKSRRPSALKGAAAPRRAKPKPAAKSRRLTPSLTGKKGRKTPAPRTRKPERPGPDGLTNQQRVFVEEYLTTWNAAEAARRAKYSSKTARQQGSRLLTIVDIRKEVDRRLTTMAMGSDEVLARLADIARADMSDFFTKKGGHLALSLSAAAKAGKLHLVKKHRLGIDSESIELHDSLAALQLIGRHHKLFADVQEHQGQVNLVELTMEEWKAQAAQRRAAAGGTLALFNDQVETSRIPSDRDTGISGESPDV